MVVIAVMHGVVRGVDVGCEVMCADSWKSWDQASREEITLYRLSA